MLSRSFARSIAPAICCVLSCIAAIPPHSVAQTPPSTPPGSQPATQASQSPAGSAQTIIVPTGTRVPLVLRNGVNTRTAKPGDSIYFETAYPIAVNNRMAIPLGSFLRGEIVEAKRPGRIKGRGEFRIAIEQITFSNGYTIDLRATPSSVDRNGREGVDSEGKIKGPSSVGRDTAIVLTSTVGGAYIGTLAGAVANGAAGRGALIGGGIGGVAGLVGVLATRGPEAELPRGTTMDVILDRPLVLDAAIVPATSGTVSDPLRAAPLSQPDHTEPRRTLPHPPLWPFPIR